MKHEKIYSVEFMSYTNCMQDAVSDWDGEGSPNLTNIKYLDVQSPFLVRESHLPYFQKFGQGFKSIVFVGYLNECESFVRDTPIDHTKYEEDFCSTRTNADLNSGTIYTYNTNTQKFEGDSET